MGMMATKLDHRLDLANDDCSSSSAISNIHSPYFGVYVPNEILENGKPLTYVFTDKSEALKALKKHKKARYKEFKTKEDAEEFVLNGMPPILPTHDVAPSQPVGEKPVMFRGPKSQDLVRLRKAIECGDFDFVHTKIWENPRYLISSGDTPSILQEGSRYNALHSAAKAKNAKITELIIQTIGDPGYAGFLYGDDDTESTEERARILLDLYLNTPDKGLNETPLHFAVKFGAKDVVEVLVGSPQCDRNVKNKFGQTPSDMVCSRDNTSNAALKKDILDLLQDQYYVPVLRSEDNSSQPRIGLPFSPSHPLVLNTNPMDSRVQIQAFAGPMMEEQAKVFHKKWKTPPRATTPSQSTWASRRLQDTEKGLEWMGRNLAIEFGCNWKEYWPFMDTFTDFATSEGLEKLEAFFKEKFAQKANPSTPSTPTTPVTALSCSSMEGITPICSEKREMEKTPLSPMSELCLSLETCSLMDNKDGPRLNRGRNIPVSKTLEMNSHREEEVLMNMITNPGLSPFLCIEKSCQVYAKRIADGLMHITAVGDPASDLLKQEVKHLQTLICSYMDDPRFMSVDFHLVHSRIASIVNHHLLYISREEFDSIANFCSDVSANHQSAYYSSSDEEEIGIPAETYRSRNVTGKISKRDASMFSDHIKCIIQHIRNGFHLRDDSHEENGRDILTEEECMNLWSDAIECSCHWQTQSFLRNSRKGSSFKRMKYVANNKLLDAEDNLAIDEVARRLNYESSVGFTSKERRGALMEKGQGKMLGSSSASAITDGDANEESDIESGEEFLTAPNSVHDDESSLDEGMSSAEEDEEVFINGHLGTSMDLAVFQAIEKCRISASDYPNVYRWRHMMLLRPAEERARWGRQMNTSRIKLDESSMSGPYNTPTKSAQRLQPFESWHRVVGPLSPASPQFKRSFFK